MTPLISILLCTFQGEKFLNTQIDSLLNQSYKNIEILVFDDASSDNTVKIIKSYQSQYNNIHLFINAKRLGFIKNFEQAITYCLKKRKNNYIALCDQDDQWHPNKLSHSIKYLQSIEQKNQKNTALVHCDLRLIDNNNQEIASSFFRKKNIFFPNQKSLSTLLGYNGVMGNTLLMNRYLAEISIPFPPQLKYHDYWISIINELFGTRATIQQPLIDYRLHNTNTSNNKIPPKKNWRKLYQKTIERNWKIPFHCDQREHTIHYLLQKFPDINNRDRLFLKKYLRYLNSKMSRMEALLFLFQEGFLKNSWKHKISVIFRILSSRSYF